jgi:hypothetical protein
MCVCVCVCVCVVVPRQKDTDRADHRQKPKGRRQQAASSGQQTAGIRQQTVCLCVCACVCVCVCVPPCEARQSKMRTSTHPLGVHSCFKENGLAWPESDRTMCDLREYAYKFLT